MAMEEILDSIRRIIYKWVNTVTSITSNVNIGDTVINVTSMHRFQVGDQVMLKNETVYETSLNIAEVDREAKTITLSRAVSNAWLVSDNTVLIKTIGEQFVQGIYIGDPDVIVKYPAITVNGINRKSEWLTLESTKETYDLEIGVFVKDSTHEKGYRFLMQMTDTIQKGLKMNIFPIPNDWDIISLTADANEGDLTMTVEDNSGFNDYPRFIIENAEVHQDNWVTQIDEDGVTVQLQEPIITDFDKDNTSVILPHRYIYNSWPSDIAYGKIHKGELLKASTIKWFGEEEELQIDRRYEGKLF